MQTILIQLSENRWTLQALHLACSMAKHNDGKIVSLRLIPAYHPAYLGTEFGDSTPTPEEYKVIAACTAAAEDYGVNLSVQSMQYLSAMDAVIDAAEQLNAEVVFAHVPPSHLSYWRKFQIWKLQRRLATSHTRLYTLDQPEEAEAQLTSIIVKPVHNLR